MHRYLLFLFVCTDLGIWRPVSSGCSVADNSNQSQMSADYTGTQQEFIDRFVAGDTQLPAAVNLLSLSSGKERQQHPLSVQHSDSPDRLPFSGMQLVGKNAESAGSSPAVATPKTPQPQRSSNDLPLVQLVRDYMVPRCCRAAPDSVVPEMYSSEVAAVLSGVGESLRAVCYFMFCICCVLFVVLLSTDPHSYQVYTYFCQPQAQATAATAICVAAATTAPATVSSPASPAGIAYARCCNYHQPAASH